jgi:DNA-directed RNA polymerase specialized sigma subunit
MRLMAGMLRNDEWMPNAPNMTDSEMEMARLTYQFVNSKSRALLRQYLLMTNSIPEIAKALGMDEEGVLDQFTSVRRMLLLRIDTSGRQETGRGIGWKAHAAKRTISLYLQRGRID